MLTFKVPGLPDASGRLQWTPIEVAHVRGRTLATYLSEDLSLPAGKTNHSIHEGKLYRPDAFVMVELPETRAAKFWRSIRGGEKPTKQIAEYDALIPRDGDEIFVIPEVEGKNTALYLGIVGAVVGFVATGGLSAGLVAGTIQGALTGYAVGSTIGSLLTPTPRTQKPGDDGPSSYAWSGVDNDVRAGIAEPVLLGERLVGGVRISAFRRLTPTIFGSHSEKIHALYMVSVGPVEGPVGVTNPNIAVDLNSNKPDIRINGQHYTNFPGVTVEWRTGEAGQSVISGFDAIRNTFGTNATFGTYVAGTPLPSTYTYATVGDQVDRIELIFDCINGLARVKDDGSIRENSTKLRVRYRVTGGGVWTDLGLQTFTAASRARVLRSFVLPPLTPNRYDVEISFDSATFHDINKDVWNITLTGVTEEKQESRNYEGRALVAIHGLATENLSGQIPTVTGVWRGIKPRVWNGSSFNPAAWGVGTAAPIGRNTGWLALEIMRNTVWGAGTEIPDTDIDLNSLKALADWAAENETVTPVVGSPYTEPRFQLDVYLDTQQAFIDLMQDILGTCRATLVISGNKWRAVMDRVSSPVQLFAMANIKEGSFEINYRSERTKVNTFDTTINDRAIDYEAEPVSVSIDSRPLASGGGVFRSEDDLVALGIPVRRRGMSMFGITRQTQCIRENRFRLKANYALRELVRFGASTDAILCEAGDLINVSHDLPQWGYSGNVMEGSTESMVMLDAYFGNGPNDVPFGAGTYQLLIRFRDGSQEAGEFRTVADAPPLAGESAFYGLAVTTPFTRVPQAGDIWVFGPVNTTVKPFRVLEISRDADNQRELTAMEYNASIHDLAGAINIPNYSLLPVYGAPPPAIVDLKASEEKDARLDDRRPSTILVQWTPPRTEPGKGVYKDAFLEFSRNNVNWEAVGHFASEYRWADAAQGETLWFRVTPRSTSDRLGVTTAAVSIVVSGVTDAPPVVAAFTAIAFEGQFIFEWPELDKKYEYEVRETNPANWKTEPTAPLYRGRSQKFVIEQPTSRTKQLWIRVVDAYRNYSAAVSNTAVDSLPGAPTIDSIERYKNGLRVKVSPPAATTPNDFVAIHLHASSVPGFTPSVANRVAQVISPSGGEAIFQVPAGGSSSWYFKATVEDWLSFRLNDWSYSTEMSGALIVITPTLPNTVVLALLDVNEGGLGGRSLHRDNATGEFVPYKVKRPRITWLHTDNVSNPAGSLIGFQVIIYITDPNAPLVDTGIIANPAQRVVDFRELTDQVPRTVLAAVKAIYTDGFSSAYVNSAGQTLTPEGDTPLSQLIVDEFGRFELPDTCADYFPFDKSAYGVRGTQPLNTPASIYDLDGYGAVVESAFDNRITDFDLTAWTNDGTCSVTKVNDVKPPIPGGWDVYKLTKITAFGDAYVFKAFAMFASMLGQMVSGSAWVLNGTEDTLQFFPYLFAPSPGSGSTAGHLATNISPGTWQRVQTSQVSWSAADTSLALVMRATGLSSGESFFVAVPQLSQSYFAHSPAKISRGEGLLAFPPLSAAGKSWTAFFKFKRQAQSLPRAIGNTYTNLFTLRTASGSPIFELKADALSGVATRVLTARAFDGTTTSDSALYAVTIGEMDEHVIAIKRVNLAITVYLNGAPVISWTMPNDPSVGTRVPTLLAIGSDPTNVSAVSNAMFRNLALFKVALPDDDILAISRQGVRFSVPAPKFAVPKPSLVTLTEVDNN